MVITQDTQDSDCDPCVLRLKGSGGRTLALWMWVRTAHVVSAELLSGHITGGAKLEAAFGPPGTGTLPGTPGGGEEVPPL